MASIKKLNKKINQEVPESAEQVLTPVATQEEKEKFENVTTSADIEVLEKALILVSKKFKLDDRYVVTQFKNSWVKSVITMSSKDFDVTVVIKDNEKQGLI